MIFPCKQVDFSFLDQTAVSVDIWKLCGAESSWQSCSIEESEKAVAGEWYESSRKAQIKPPPNLFKLAHGVWTKKTQILEYF